MHKGGQVSVHENTVEVSSASRKGSTLDQVGKWRGEVVQQWWSRSWSTRYHVPCSCEGRNLAAST